MRNYAQNNSKYILTKTFTGCIIILIGSKFMNIERRKYLGQPYKDYIKSFDTKIIRIENNEFKGYLSYLKIHEVHRTFDVLLDDKKICLYNNGYSELNYLPDNRNWQLYAIYDNNFNIIEWYIDITRKNSIDENGNPYCDDLYLDIVLMPDGKILFLDEDELLDAYNNKTINQTDLDLAYKTKNELINSKIVSIEYMEILCKKLFENIRNMNKSK
jgi:predicted RNA-binding protein associated with RNAse of E/G family